jgi:quercetin dioxygenase-like cupin family protein
MNQPIQLPHEIGDGNDREVRMLLSDRRRKLVLIQLRRGALLADHSAKVPITIQAILGKGTLRVGPDAHPLVPGVIVPVDAHVVHSVRAEPAVAILVSFFRNGEISGEDDTTARFD